MTEPGLIYAFPLQKQCRSRWYICSDTYYALPIDYVNRLFAIAMLRWNIARTHSCRVNQRQFDVIDCKLFFNL